MLNLTPESIVKYVNYAFLILIFLRAFVGFCRGTKKSIYYLIATLIVYVGGFLLMNKMVDYIMAFDVSSYNFTFGYDGQTITVTTVNELIYYFLTTEVFVGADLTNTVTVALIQGAVAIVVKLVYFLVLIILSDTILKIIFDIIWLFIRPKKVETEKGNMKRPKPKFLSRLGGFAIGACKGAFLLLILFFLVGGIASIVVDVNDTVNLTEDSGKYDVILLGNNLVLLEEEQTNEKGIVEEFKEQCADYIPYLEAIAGYRTATIPGKIYGMVKLDDACIDEYIFDKFFSIDIDVEDGDYVFSENVEIRKELHSLSLALQALKEEDPDFIDNLSKGDLTKLSKESLNNAVAALSELKIVNVVVPVAVEIVFLTDTLTKDNPDLANIIQGLDYDEIRSQTSSLNGDFEKLGYTFVNVIDLLNFTTNLDSIDFLSFDPATVQEIFEQLGELGLVNSFTPIIIDYILTMEQVKNAITDLGLDFDEVSNALKSIDDWGAEVSQLGVIASKVLELGIDKSDAENLDLSKVDMDKVDELVTEIFKSKLVDEALPIVVSVALDKLEENEQAAKYITYLNISKDTDWEKELTPLINSVLVLMKNGFNSKESLENILLTLRNMPDEAFDEIGGYISESGLVTNALNGIIKELLNGGSIEFLNGVTIEGFTEEEIQNGEAWTKEEIAGIFKAAKSLITLITNDKGETIEMTEALKTLDDATIDSLATNLSKSTFLKRNLSSVLDAVLHNVLSDAELTLKTLNEDEWDKEELSAIFSSMMDLLNTGILDSSADITTSLTSLTDAQIEELAKDVSSSKFLTQNFGVIIDYALGKADLGFDIEGLDEEGVWDENELIALFKSAKILLGYTTGDKEITDLLFSEDETEIDTLLNSKVISKSIGSFLKAMTATDESGNPTGKYDLTVVKGVDKVKDGEWEDKLTKVAVDASITGNVVTINDEATILSTNNASRLDIYLNGVYVGSSTNGSFDFTSYLTSHEKDALTEDDTITYSTRSDGEVRKIFGAFSKIAKDAYKDGKLDSDQLVKNITSLTDSDVDKVTASSVITETIKSYLADLGNDTGSGYGLVVKDVETLDLNAELKALIKSVKLLFGDDVDINNLNFEANEILSNLTKLTNDITKEIGDEDQVGIILSSQILCDTLIKFIEDEAKKDDAVFVVPDGIIYKDYYEADVKKSGELRALFTSISTLFPSGTVDLNNIKLNTLFNATDETLDNFLASQILLATVKDIIIDLDTRSETGDTTIVVNLTAIEEKGWKAEIKSMIKAIKFVLGEDADLENVNSVDVNKVLGATDEELDSILGSLIVTDTLIKVLYDQSDVDYLGQTKSTPGTIIIPIDDLGAKYTLASDFWRDTYVGNVKTKDGEVRKIFKGIRAMFTKDGKLSVDFDNINADAILDMDDDSIDTLLDSDVLAVTIESYIVKLDTRGDGGSGSTTIYVNESNITKNGRTWNTEIKALLKAFKTLIKPDADGKYSLENATDIDINQVLDPDNKVKFLSSVIISDTIIANLEANSSVYTRDGLDWYGTDGTNGELGKFIDAAELVLKNDSGEIDINNFSEDNLTSLTNNFSAPDKYAYDSVTNHYADEVGILISSTVLRDTIVSNIVKIDSINLTVTAVEEDSYWNDNGSTKGEVRNLLTSFNIILGSSKISNFEFSMDNLLEKDKSQIEQAINGSDIISNTCASTLSKVLYEDSLNGMIAEPTGSLTRMQYVKSDQVNLICVFKDLKNDFNISYSSFNYTAFTSAIGTDLDAYNLSDCLTQSTILTDSLSKMFYQIIDGNSSLSSSVKTKVLTSIDSMTTWANPTKVGTTKTFGELALLFRALGVLNTFGNDSSTLSASTMKEPLEKLNASKVLQPVVTEILEKALDSVSSWKKANATLTSVEWNYEISLLVDLIQFVENDLGGNLSGVTNASDLTSDKLQSLIVYISKSRILDVTKINDIVQSAVDNIFTKGTYQAGDTVATDYASSNTGCVSVAIEGDVTEATMTITGYTNTAYDTFVSAWGVEATGITTAIAKLNAIDFNLLTAVTDFTIYEYTDTTPSHSERKLVHGMRLIGIFLDACEDTKTLKNTVSGVADTYGVTKGTYANWEEAFVAKVSSI